MIWDAKSEYPGVRVFAQHMKEAIMTAHDAILEACVKQTRQANKHRKPAPFGKDDFVYLSTKNLTIPKNRLCKVVPKFIGPYCILELPSDLKRKGNHPAFHSSLLRIHNPNDDRRFPGRQIPQITGLGEGTQEWVVDKILAHSGKGKAALFNVLWKTGDTAWFPYKEISHLQSFVDYLDIQGASTIGNLPQGMGKPPDNIEVAVAAISLNIEADNNFISDVATMSPKPTYNENVSGSFSLGHIKLFRVYSAQLNGDTDGSLDVPIHYDDWVFEIRDKQGKHADLPRFSDDYVGPIPGLKKSKVLAQDTPTDSEGFLLRFAINRLELSNKQADINNCASEALFESGICAVQRGRSRGHHLRRFQNHRATDTYYGTGMDDTHSHRENTSECGTSRQRSRSVDTVNVPGTKRGHSVSAEERSVHPRCDTDEHAACGCSHSQTMAHDITRPHSPYRRPSSHSMERVAERSRERLDRELSEFRIRRVAENDKAQFERDLADAYGVHIVQISFHTLSSLHTHSVGSAHIHRVVSCLLWCVWHYFSAPPSRHHYPPTLASEFILAADHSEPSIKAGLCFKNK
jgi:hypothetical protein